MKTYLQSNSAEDVHEIWKRTDEQSRHYWEHTCMPQKSEIGSQIIIGPNEKERKKYTQNAPIAVIGIIVEKEKINESSKNWTSNKLGSNNDKKFPARIWFDDIRIVTKEELQNILDGRTPNQRGILYID